MADKKTPEVFVCPDCGSDSISVPADAYWDICEQRWVLDSVQNSDDYCAECGDYKRGAFRLANFKELAQIAIRKQEEGYDWEFRTTRKVCV